MWNGNSLELLFFQFLTLVSKARTISCRVELIEFSVFQKFQGFSNFLQIGNNISSITKKASKAGIISLIDEEFTGIINVEFKNYRIAKEILIHIRKNSYLDEMVIAAAFGILGIIKL